MKWCLTLATLLCLCLLLFVWRKAPQQDAEELLRQARLAAARGDFQSAADLAVTAANADPKLTSARLVAVECMESLQQYEAALSQIAEITPDKPKDWLNGKKFEADILHYQLNRLSEAEKCYLTILEVAPDDPDANDGYARLLGLCGRRSEAIPCVLRLIQKGIYSDLLILMSRISGSLSDPQLLEAARSATPDDPLPLLGLAKLAEAKQQPELALEYMFEAARLSQKLPSSFTGKFGRLLLQNQKWTELNQWSRDLEPETATAESLSVLANLAEQQDDIEGAIRCYWEACRKRPESLTELSQLARLLSERGQTQQANKLLKRINELNDLRDAQRVAIMSEEDPELAELVTMIKAYQKTGRLWEALAWSGIVLESEPQSQILRGIREQVTNDLRDAPLQLTIPEMNPAHLIDLSEFSYPTPRKTDPQHTTYVTSADIRFMRQDKDIGFDFVFFNGSATPTRRMFEFGGGGLAAIDFDKDGAPDLFCSQGRCFEQNHQSAHYHDQLFRNIRCASFAQVANPAGLADETGFGQGVAVGDIDNDGFPDLYVACLRQNTIWLNNGDGTFSGADFQSGSDETEWTTSCLIADLNGDSITDLYDVNYLTGPDVFDRVCSSEDGSQIQCSPYDFEAARDRLWIGLGNGSFVDKTSEYLTPQPDGKGLGIVAFDKGDGALSFFVANDTVANFFYTRDSDDNELLTNTALQAGLAYNGTGKAEACMGIAAADCTGDSRIDLLVTNFLYESNTLYSPIDQSHYRDITRDSGLHDPSLPVLGWGTQFIDANLNGRHELFVANGYPQDLSHSGTPFAMRPQIFEWIDSRFQPRTASRAGKWLDEEVVGRAATKIDWNNDGRPDIAVGVQHARSFLLTNQSRQPGNYLSLSLVAVDSARDSIGASVSARMGDDTSFFQLTGGDGYQSSNQRHLLIGCGKKHRIDNLEIRWPSGLIQSFDSVSLPAKLTAVEGRSKLYTKP